MKYNAQYIVHVILIKKISLNKNFVFAMQMDGNLIRLIKIKFVIELIHIKVFKVTNVYLLI